MNKPRTLQRILLILMAFMLFVGCRRNDSQPSKSNATKLAQAYLLSSEPEAAQTPTEVKDSFSETSLDASEVVLVGRIDAGDLVPFEAGRATFVLSELPDKEHAAGDPEHANNCPFCKRKLKNAPKVVVQFVDATGSVIAKDAQELLGVKKGDRVVVVGKADYQKALNIIELNATGVYVKKE